MNFKEGDVLYFDKPLKWTSFAVVNKIRCHICRKLGVKKIKVGHAGTLDPLATGVMIICTGKATKRIEEFQYHTKEYIATLQLGATTPSFDLEKEIDATYPTEHITRELVEEALQRFIGRIEQIPPVFSACKVDGKRAYDLARKGEDVELKAKTLIIDSSSAGFAPVAAASRSCKPNSFSFSPIRLLIFPVFSLLKVSTIALLGTSPYFSIISDTPVNCPPSLKGCLNSHSTILSSMGFPLVSMIPCKNKFAFSNWS